MPESVETLVLQDEVLSDEEIVGRFVYDSEKVKASGINHGAFLPMYEHEQGRLETSVCRMAGCPEDRAWHLARTQRTDKDPKARADVEVTALAQVDPALICIAAPVDGYPEHAVLIGWPADKHAQKAWTMRLSKAVFRVVLPPP